VKGKQLAALIILILIIDQAIKFYIKTNYYIGEEHKLLGMNWARLHFVENEGMAWGWKFGGGFGKIALTVFRLIAVIVGTFYLRDIVKKNYNRGFLICAALIYAGAAGNLIDSMFYGLLFEGSNPYLQNVAHFLPVGGGYAGFLHGRVVDMFYFPIITGTTWPAWVPVWGGQDFEFFRPVFNLADASISLGVITILIFQKRFFRQHNHIKTHQTIETNSSLDDKAHIS
jgi:signal peptidase II